MAILLKDLEEGAEVGSLYRRALRIAEKAGGPEH